MYDGRPPATPQTFPFHRALAVLPPPRQCAFLSPPGSLSFSPWLLLSFPPAPLLIAAFCSPRFLFWILLCTRAESDSAWPRRSLPRRVNVCVLYKLFHRNNSTMYNRALSVVTLLCIFHLAADLSVLPLPSSFARSSFSLTFPPPLSLFLFQSLFISGGGALIIRRHGKSTSPIFRVCRAYCHACRHAGRGRGAR